MGKKIKISESQLKTIMERRHTYQVETNEEEVTDIDQLDDKDQEEVDVKEPEDIKEGFGRKNYQMGVQMVIWSHLSDMEYDTPQRRKIRCNFIKLLVKKFIPKDVEITEAKLDDLWDKLSNGDTKGAMSALEDSPEEPMKDIPGFEGTMDKLNSLSIRKDDTMNESVKKIKSEFKRFL